MLGRLRPKNNIVLIFDECTSGFRQTLGGLHKFYGIDPDMAVFGKALGNGYAITAVIGRREIMEEGQSSFISSTFWTERIGFSAGRKTIEVMEQLRSWESITEMGKHIKKRWEELARDYDLTIQQSGLPSLASFQFVSTNQLAYKTLLTYFFIRKRLPSEYQHLCMRRAYHRDCK